MKQKKEWLERKRKSKSRFQRRLKILRKEREKKRKERKENPVKNSRKNISRVLRTNVKKLSEETEKTIEFGKNALEKYKELFGNNLKKKNVFLIIISRKRIEIYLGKSSKIEIKKK